MTDYAVTDTDFVDDGAARVEIEVLSPSRVGLYDSLGTLERTIAMLNDESGRLAVDEVKSDGGLSTPDTSAGGVSQESVWMTDNSTGDGYDDADGGDGDDEPSNPRIQVTKSDEGYFKIGRSDSDNWRVVHPESRVYQSLYLAAAYEQRTESSWYEKELNDYWDDVEGVNSMLVMTHLRDCHMVTSVSLSMAPNHSRVTPRGIAYLEMFGRPQGKYELPDDIVVSFDD